MRFIFTRGRCTPSPGSAMESMGASGVNRIVWLPLRAHRTGYRARNVVPGSRIGTPCAQSGQASGA
jgi:hypothetical protein